MTEPGSLQIREDVDRLCFPLLHHFFFFFGSSFCLDLWAGIPVGSCAGWPCQVRCQRGVGLSAWWQLVLPAWLAICQEQSSATCRRPRRSSWRWSLEVFLRQVLGEQQEWCRCWLHIYGIGNHSEEVFGWRTEQIDGNYIAATIGSNIGNYILFRPYWEQRTTFVFSQRCSHLVFLDNFVGKLNEG